MQPFEHISLLLGVQVGHQCQFGIVFRDDGGREAVTAVEVLACEYLHCEVYHFLSSCRVQI